jgi:hypothetical protein
VIFCGINVWDGLNSIMGNKKKEWVN